MYLRVFWVVRSVSPAFKLPMSAVEVPKAKNQRPSIVSKWSGLRALVVRMRIEHLRVHEVHEAGPPDCVVQARVQARTAYAGPKVRRWALPSQIATVNCVGLEGLDSNGIVR